MPNYSEKLIITLTLDATVADIAAKVGKALDPDVGGEHSFHDNGDGTITADTPCIPEFKAYAEQLMTDADMLYVEVGKAYAERWADLTAPTLAECQAFIAAIIPDTDNG